MTTIMLDASLGKIRASTVPIVVDKVCINTMQKLANKNNANLLNFEEQIITTKNVLSPISLTKINESALQTPSQNDPFSLNCPKANCVVVSSYSSSSEMSPSCRFRVELFWRACTAKTIKSSRIYLVKWLKAITLYFLSIQITKIK